MTLVFLDTETTGLDPAVHQIWEIAYAIDDGPVLSSPVGHSLWDATTEALAVGRYWERRLVSDGASAVFERELQQQLDGATVVGANPAFDTAMLRARWKCAPWHYRLLDVEAYAMPFLELEQPRGLAYIAEQLDVIPPNHTAAGDVTTLRLCFQVLRRRYGVLPRSGQEVPA